jgi:BirA family biotin operon repressor/biotin-[acetyl-CoA-carboxylase] ligase
MLSALMNTTMFAALRLLADGEFRSGQDIARRLGISRTSVWNALHALDSGMGIEVFKVRGRGYRLAEPLSLLDHTVIKRHLGARAAHFKIELLDSTDSTNTLLMQRVADGAESGSVIVAEWQTHGRGRRGRAWHTALGSALTFSVLWRFQQGAGFLGGLSLAVSVAVARTLASLGITDCGVKWPNDVLWHGCKLAGILIEMQGDMLGPSVAIIGIGLNCRLPDAVRVHIDQPVVDLEQIIGGKVDRNRLLALLLIELDQVLNTFAHDGFAPLRDEWQHRHVYQRKTVKLKLPDGGLVSGTVEGVAENGALLLTTKAGRRRFHGGDISLHRTAT